MSIFTRLRDFCGLNDPADYDYDYDIPSPTVRTVEEVMDELANAAELPQEGSSHEVLPFYDEILVEEPSPQAHVTSQHAFSAQPLVGQELQEAFDFLNEVEEERNEALRRQRELSQVEETHASIEIILDSMETQGLTAGVLEERRQAALSKGQSLRERLQKQRQVHVRPPIPSYVPEADSIPTFNSLVLEEDDDDVPF